MAVLFERLWYSYSRAFESELSSDSRLGEGDTRRSVLLGRAHAGLKNTTVLFQNQPSKVKKTTHFVLKNRSSNKDSIIVVIVVATLRSALATLHT